jgi:hypothetical protein
MTFAEAPAVKQRRVAGVSVIVLSMIIVVAWLIVFPRAAKTRAPVTTPIEPSASPRPVGERTVPDAVATAAEPSASPPPRAERNVRRPPRAVEERERHTDDELDRQDHDRTLFLGLMLFLATQRHPQAP